MTEPAQKPGRSKQDYGTPWEFIRAVEARWGCLYIDLAASAHNAKAPIWIDEKENSFYVNWASFAHTRAWLNPPFSNIADWAARCAHLAGDFSKAGGRIFLLTPASIGTEWFADHVHRRAMVYGLRPRLTFEGTTDPYPKDLMLSVFGVAPGFDTWRWK